MAAHDVELVAEQLAKTNVDVQNQLSFEGRGLKLNTEEDAREITEAIERCEHMTALCLSGNTIGVDAAKAIAGALEKHPEFQKAYWSDIFTGRLKTEIPQALTHLGGGIITAGAQLVELDFSDNAFGPNGIIGATDFLKSQSCYTLQELRFNNNGLGIGGGKMLAESLIECHARSSAAGKPLSLKVFVCGRNRLENDGAAHMARALKTIGTLEEITMLQNFIQHRGIASIADALLSNLNLRLLNLNDNTFTTKGANSMAKVLPHLQNLEVINFGDCIMRSTGGIAIAKSLQDGHRKLKELLLNGNELDVTAARAVCGCIKNKDHLQKLDLNGNEFGADGVREVGELMAKLSKSDLLSSMSDDEGSADEGAVEDNDEEEEVEDVTGEGDGEILDDPNLQVHGISVTPQKQISAKDFLQFPSPSKLMQLGNARASVIRQELGDNATDVDEAIKTAIRISSVVTPSDIKSKEAACDCADELLKGILASSENTASLVSNTLLVHLGLIKAEDKTFRPPSDITGPLLVLEHVIKQMYFPKFARDVLLTFISTPHPLLEKSSEARHHILQTLYSF